jgi:hypothetical protein
MPTGFHMLHIVNQNDWAKIHPTETTQLIIWKVHVAHNREHGYHDSLYSTEVTQLYLQVDDFIAS